MLNWPLPKGNNETSYDYYSRVHSWALAKFSYKRDQEVWQQPDHWDSKEELETLFLANGAIFGDCDDFTQLCRHALAISNIPSRIVLCFVETGEYHAVAETPDGYVLENRSSRVTVWKALEVIGYKKHIMGPLVLANSPTTEEWHEAL